MEAIKAMSKGIMLGLALLMVIFTFAGCATTLDGVRAKDKAEILGATAHDVAKEIAGSEGTSGCEITLEDEVARVICW